MRSVSIRNLVPNCSAGCCVSDKWGMVGCV